MTKKNFTKSVARLAGATSPAKKQRTKKIVSAFGVGAVDTSGYRIVQVHTSIWRRLIVPAGSDEDAIAVMEVGGGVEIEPPNNITLSITVKQLPTSLSEKTKIKLGLGSIEEKVNE